MVQSGFQFFHCKLLLVVCCLQISAFALLAQSTWDGSEGDNDWTNTDNWDVAPGAGDDVIIPSGMTDYPVLNATPGVTYNSITVQAGGELFLNDFTVNAATVTNAGIIYSTGFGATLDIDTNTGTVEYESGSTLNISTGGAQSYANLSFSGGTFTLPSGLSVSGDFTLDGGTITLGADITLDGDVTLTSGDLDLAGYTLLASTSDWDHSGITFTPDSGTVELGSNANVNQGGGANFYNLTLQAGGTSTSELRIEGNLTVSSGTFVDHTDGTYVTGDIDASGGIITFSNNLRFNGGTQSINLGAGSTLANLILYNTVPGTVSFISDLTVTGILEIQNDRVLSMGANDLSVDGQTFSNGTLTSTTGTQTFSGDFTLVNLTASSNTTTFSGDVTLTTFTENGGTVVFNAGGAQTLTSNSQDLGTTQISGTSTVLEMQDATTFGALTIDSGATLDTGVYALTVDTGGAAVDGTLDASAQTAASSITGNLSGSGSATFNTGDVTVSGDVSVGTFTASSGTTSVGGSFTSAAFVHNSGRLLLDGTSAANVGSYSFYDLEIAKTGATVTSTGAWTVTNGLTMTGGTWDPGNYSHQITGDWNDSSISFVPTTGTIQLNSSNPAITQGGSNKFYNLILDIGGAPTSDITITGDLTLTSGTLAMGANALDVSGDASIGGALTGSAAVSIGSNLSGAGSADFSAGASTASIGGDVTLASFTASSGSTTVGESFTPGAFVHNGGTLTMNGATPAVDILGATYNNLIINKDTSTDTVTAQGALTIVDALTITQGVLETGTYALTVSGATAIAANGSLDAGAQTGATSLNSISGAGSASFGAGAVTVSGTSSISNLTASSATTTFFGNVTLSNFTANSGTVELAGTADQTITTNAESFNALSVTKTGGTVTSSGDVDAYSYSQNVSGGTFALSSGDTMNISSSASITAGTLTLNGAYSGSGATFTVGGGTVNVAALAFEAGDMTVSSGSFTQTGDNSSETQEVASLSVTGGSCTWDAGSAGGTLAISGALSNLASLDFNLKNVTLGGTTDLSNITFGDGTLIIGGAGTVALTSGSTEIYALSILAGATLQPQDGITVNQNVSIANTGSYDDNGQTLTLGGSGAVDGTITDSNATTLQDLGAVVIDDNSLTRTKTLGSDLQMSTLTLTSGEIEVGANELTISDDFSSAIGTTLDNSNGSGVMHIGGDADFSGSYTYGGAIYFDGGVSQNLTFGSNNLGTVRVETASTDLQFTNSGSMSAVNIATGAQISTSNFNLDAVTINVDGVLDASGQTLTETSTISAGLSGSGAATFGAGSVTINGDTTVSTFTAGSGAVDINAGAGSVTAATSFTESSNTTNIAAASVDFSGGFTANGGTLTFDRNGATSLTSNGAYNNVIIDGSQVVNLANDMSVGGDLVINDGGTLALAGNDLGVTGNMDANGSFTSAAAGTTTIGGYFRIASTGTSTLSGALTLTTGNFSSDGTFSAAGGVSVAGDFSHNLGTVTLTSNLTVGGALTQADGAGTFTSSGDIFLSNSTSHVFNANLQLNGDLTLTIDDGGSLQIGYDSADTFTLGTGSGTNTVTITETTTGSGSFSSLTVKAAVSGSGTGNLALNLDGPASFNAALDIGDNSANPVLSIASAGNTSFGSTVDSDADGAAALIISGSGDVSFASAVALNSSGVQAMSVTGTGDVDFASTLDSDEGLSQANGAGEITFSGDVSVSGATTVTALLADVTLEAMAFVSNTDITFGNAATDNLTISTGAVTINTSSGPAPIVINSDVASSGGAQDLSFIACTDVTAGSSSPVTINGMIGTSGANLIDDFTIRSNDIRLYGTGIYTSGAQTYLSDSSNNEEGGTIIAFSSAGDIDAGGNDITFDDLYIDTSNAITLPSGTVGTIFTDRFTFYNGAVNLNGTNITTDDDFVVLGHNGGTDIDDPHASGSGEWDYPDAVSLYYDPGAGYTASFGAGLQGVIITVDDDGDVTTNGSGNFYVNNTDLYATSAWTLELPRNIDTDPTSETPWGWPFAIVLNSQISYAGVGSSEVIIAANAVTVSSAGVVSNTNVGATSDEIDWSTDVIPLYEQPDSGNSYAINTDTTHGTTTAILIDNPGNYGFDFTETTISAVTSIKDDLLRIDFNKPIRNLSNRINPALFFTDPDDLNVPFAAAFLDGDDLDPASNYSSASSNPLTSSYQWIQTIYLQTGGNTWRTDAVGGATGSGTDSRGQTANANSMVPDLVVAKGALFGTSGADLVVPDWAGQDERYDSTVDGAGPVLWKIEVGRMDHASDVTNYSPTQEADGHNFFHLYYSEAIDFDGDSTATMDLADGGTAYDFLQAQADGGPGSYGGEIIDSGDSIVVSNFFSYTAPGYASDDPSISMLKGSVVAGPTTIDTIRKLADNQVGIYLAAYYDSMNNYWPGWVFNVLDPLASSDDSIVVFPNDLSSTGTEYSSVVDGQSNPIDYAESEAVLHATDNTGVRNSAAVTVDFTESTAGVDTPFWDVSPPGFSSTAASSNPSPPVSSVLSNEPSGHEIVIVDDTGDLILDSFDFYIQDNFYTPTIAGVITGEDNTATPGNWVPSADHPDVYGDRQILSPGGTTADVARGIRDGIFTNNGSFLDAFRVGIKDTALTDSTVLSDASANVDTGVGTGFSGSDIDTADDPYFRISYDGSHFDWSITTELYMTYNAGEGFLTDLAGNLMPSSGHYNQFAAYFQQPNYGDGFPSDTYGQNPYYDGVSEAGKLIAIELTPPEIRLALSAVGGNKVYVKFTEPVFGSEALDSQVDYSDFAFGDASNSIVGIEILDTNTNFGTVPGVTEAYLVLNSEIDSSMLLDSYITANTSAVWDKSGNSFSDSDQRQLSDVGLGVLAPLSATDGIQQDGTRGGGFTSIRTFDGSEHLDDLDISIQSSLAADIPSAYEGLPVGLIYDVNVSDSLKSELLDGGTGEFWSNVTVDGLIETANNEARIAQVQSLGTTVSEHSISSGDSEIARGAVLEFIYTFAGLPIATVDNPNTPLNLRPFRISIGPAAVQRGGVTILNNVINPDNGDETVVNYALERSGMVVVNVFTLDGDLVKVLQRGRQAVGTYNLSWDGTNSNGDTVVRGFYFIRVVGPDVDQVRKVLVVR